MDQVDIKIGEDLVRPIIEAKIQTAIVEALGDEKGLIERVVAEALTKKIEPERYSSKKVPWIEHICKKMIRQAAQDAIESWAESHKDRITEEFLRQLKTRKTSSAVVKSMIEGMAAVAGSRWMFKVELPE